ncbi:MAG: response regulator [bacterium]|nr:response regulator [bacterium]
MSKTIMIVDDSVAIRQTVGFTLHEAGYTVIEACDGEDALAKLNGQQIDLIISDVNMPNMDGITLLKTVKSDKSYSAYKFAPFIMLTTEAGASKKEEGKEAGAKAWMVKPFKADQLLSAVKKLII